jgi:7,8-dihydropterin-6-yl-methyl-4-(beta-D-ribofuranosyl)aminobenzene 5'-phosphate synthase
MSETVTLLPVDAAEVLILVDNAIDVLVASSEIARRPALAPDWSLRRQLRAEHGYSLLLGFERDGHGDQLLYDAGLTRDTLAHNLDVLEAGLSDLRALVLSHGHADHHGGLEGLFARAGRRSLPLVLHPDAWRQRRIVFPTGNEARLPPPSRADLDHEGWEIVEEVGPSLLLDGSVLVTGQVERVTDFERGMASHQRLGGGTWEPDTWIWDDQAVVFHVRDKGLVVLSSCSHAGAVNVIRHAMRLTGVERLHAFVGGCHLTGGAFDAIIPRTVEELIALAPDAIVPGHCTGWRANALLATAMPDAYQQSSVGTRLHFGA